MSNKMSLAVIAITSTIALSACTFTHNTTVNNNRFTRRLVSEKSLNNGSKLMIGARAPSADNQCKLINTVDSDYRTILRKAQTGIHLGNGVQSVLNQRAVDFANKHSNVNYAYIYIPNIKTNGISNGNSSISTIGNGTIVTRYYHCQNPPKKHSNPFSG